MGGAESRCDAGRDDPPYHVAALRTRRSGGIPAVVPHFVRRSHRRHLHDGPGVSDAARAHLQLPHRPDRSDRGGDLGHAHRALARPRLPARPARRSCASAGKEMTYETILLDHDGAVSTVTLNRPPFNIIVPELMQELRHAFDALEARESTRCVVLTGAGTRAFCAGADLGDEARHTPEAGQAFRESGRAIVER